MQKPKVGIFHKAVGSVLGAGYSPIAPGTVGAFVALLVWWALDYFWVGFAEQGWWQGGLIAGSCILGTWSADRLEFVWGEDPSKVVVDELAGMWISLFLLPVNWWTLGIGFFLFRLLDIFKPFGVKKAEDLPGGYGIMADDIFAGIYTNLVLQLLLALEWIPF